MLFRKFHHFITSITLTASLFSCQTNSPISADSTDLSCCNFTDATQLVDSTPDISHQLDNSCQCDAGGSEASLDTSDSRSITDGTESNACPEPISSEECSNGQACTQIQRVNCPGSSLIYSVKVTCTCQTTSQYFCPVAAPTNCTP